MRPPPTTITTKINICNDDVQAVEAAMMLMRGKEIEERASLSEDASNDYWKKIVCRQSIARAKRVDGFLRL